MSLINIIGIIHSVLILGNLATAIKQMANVIGINGYSENESIAEYLLLVNEAQTAVLIPQPPADSNQ